MTDTLQKRCKGSYVVGLNQVCRDLRMLVLHTDIDQALALSVFGSIPALVSKCR